MAPHQAVLRATPKRQTKKNASWIKATGNPAHIEHRQKSKPVIMQGSADSLLGPALVCESMDDWLQPRCQHYPAMYVPRAQTWCDIQSHIDALAESDAFGRDLALEERINLAFGTEQAFAAHLSQKAQGIVDKATGAGLPKEVGDVILEDFQHVGTAMKQMAASMGPKVKMTIRLDLIGKFGCDRWHQDHNIARALVTYNGPGTVFVAHEHVDMWALKNYGKNSSLVRDPSQICSADVGAFLLMKGLKFPSVGNGLVHKSPEKKYLDNGEPKSRLLLKVDLSDCC